MATKDELELDATHPIPELAWILEALANTGEYKGNTAILGVCIAYARARPEMNPSQAFVEMTRALNALPAIVAELPEVGARTIGENALRRLLSMFEPEMLARDSREFFNAIQGQLQMVQDMMPIFDTLGPAGPATPVTLDLYAEIDALKTVVGNADSLSDASKTVIFGQLDLLSRSVHRYASSGVGPFRDSIFTVYGRIRMELDADTSATEVDKKTVVDQFLRWYSVADAVVKIGKLGAPVAMKLLQHHIGA